MLPHAPCKPRLSEGFFCSSQARQDWRWAAWAERQGTAPSETGSTMDALFCCAFVLRSHQKERRKGGHLFVPLNKPSETDLLMPCAFRWLLFGSLISPARRDRCEQAGSNAHQRVAAVSEKPPGAPAPLQRFGLRFFSKVCAPSQPIHDPFSIDCLAHVFKREYDNIKLQARAKVDVPTPELGGESITEGSIAEWVAKARDG